MKKIFSSFLISFSTLFVFGAALALNGFYIEFHQNADSDSLVKKAFALGSETTTTSAVATGSANPTCHDNYQSWPSSTTFKADAPWSTAFVSNNAINGNRMVVNSFERDLNGDGLPDYLYAEHQPVQTPNYNWSFDCVYLSNGRGWDLAYRCVVTAGVVNGVTVAKFYGDCAANT